jgi:hypothetical protein
MIRGAIAALEVRSVKSFNVIYRALLEHTVDLRYIVVLNNEHLNLRFINYYKIILHKNRKQISTQQQEVPRIEKEFEEYILNFMNDIIKEFEKKKNGKELIDWSHLTKLIYKRFSNSWTGQSFSQRVKEIKSADKQVSYLRSKGRPAQDPLLEDVSYFWSIYSSYTHPTPYSAIPHFSPRDQSFQPRYSYSNDLLLQREKYLFLILEFNVETYSISFDNDFYIEFMKKAASNPKLYKMYENVKEQNATRSRHQ